MWEFHFINFVSPSEPVCLEGHDYELCYHNPPLTITLIRIISYNNLSIPLPLRLTSSDEIPNDDLIDLRPVPARADSHVRDDVHLSFLVQPRAVAYRAVLNVDHTLKGVFRA